MKSYRLDQMTKGWFVGSFVPSVFDTKSCEVAVKEYSAGDKEEAHFHKIATEITLIVEGQIQMCDKIWGKGDIIVLEPGEISSFIALTKSVNVVVKIPGALNDKFFI